MSPAKSPIISGFFATKTAIFLCTKTQMYEVEFKSGGMEYDYVIDAATGAVLDHEVERDD